MRVFSSFSPDLAEKSYNAASYKTPHPNVAPFQAWPDPPEGFNLRLYPFSFEPTEGRFGVLSRSKTGRASCRRSVCKYVWMSGGAVLLKKKQTHTTRYIKK